MPFPTTNPALARALDARGYLEPTPVQEAVLEQGADTRDLLVSAQTGSGKTVAYALAFATNLLGDAERFERGGAPLALVVAPTRELAMQVHAELSWLYAEAGGRVVSCVGGMDSRREQRALADGCHIVVGTPGRLKDHLERRQLNVSALRVAVLDEADEMLDLGFQEELQFILDATPPERRTLLFSATIAREIVALAKQYQRDALRIDTIAKNEPHGDIEYRAYRVAPNEVEHAVVNVLRYFEQRATLVFCNTREGVKRLHGQLLERGFMAVALSGELSQYDRTTALQSIRDGRSRVCVATDVAARGLDLPDLGLVIHADLPTNKEMLLHRSGRTGRAGRKGTSVVMVPHSRRRRAEQVFMSAGVQVQWARPPSADSIRERDQERLLHDPILAETPTEEDLGLARKLLAGRTAEEIAAALIRLHRLRLPSPEEIAEDRGPPRDERPASRYKADGPVPAWRDNPRPARGGGAMAWFRIGVGRRNNADPKWLVPLICRLGGVTKAEIGAIKIFAGDTKFEIAQDVAVRFAEMVADAKEGEPQIELARGPAEGTPENAAPRRPFKKPYRKAS